LAGKKKFKAKAFKAWLDDLCKTVVKVRDNHRCQRCHTKVSGYNCQWSHVYSRKWNETRWDLDNSKVLCGTCHTWWGACPSESGVWFAELFPERQERLEEKRREYTPHPWKEDDFLAVEKVLMEAAIELDITYDQLPKNSQSKFRTRLELYKG